MCLQVKQLFRTNLLVYFDALQDSDTTAAGYWKAMK